MTTPLSTADLDAIEARAAAATPGLWHSEQPSASDYRTSDYHTLWNETESERVASVMGRDNATFIAAARTDVERLAADWRRLTAENERLTADRDCWKWNCLAQQTCKDAAETEVLRLTAENEHANVIARVEQERADDETKRRWAAEARVDRLEAALKQARGELCNTEDRGLRIFNAIEIIDAALSPTSRKADEGPAAGEGTT